ncbi:MAG TPA: hypothetical protein VLT59_07515, partial [Steroidobacteraceae bacterium]|nr:hypothetical protein [Steroidobacteraceae bacterium]
MIRRVVLIALFLLTIVPVGIVAWLLFTESGLATIAGQLYRLERFGVRIEEVSGTVRGPLAIGFIEIDTDTVHVVAREISAEPLLRSTVLQTAAFDWLRAESVDVELKPGRDDEPEREGAPRFLPAWLRVLAERVEIGGARFATADGFEIKATRIAGRLELTRTRLMASDLLVESPDFVVGGRVQLDADSRLEIDIAANGRLTGEGLPEAEVAATLRGHPGQLAVDARLETPGDAVTSLEILSDEAGWRIEGRAEADDPQLAAWVDGTPVSLRDVDLAFELDRDGFAVNGELIVPEIDVAPIALAVQGGYADRRLTIDTATLRPQDSATVLELSGQATFGDERPALDLLLTWEQFAWPLRDEPILASRSGTLAVAGSMPYRIDGSAALEVPGQPAADVALAGYAHPDR